MNGESIFHINLKRKKAKSIKPSVSTLSNWWYNKKKPLKPDREV